MIIAVIDRLDGTLDVGRESNGELQRISRAFDKPS